MAAILARLQVHDVQPPHEIEDAPLQGTDCQQAAAFGIDVETVSYTHLTLPTSDLV